MPLGAQQQQQHQRQGSLSEVLSLRLGSQPGADPTSTHRQGERLGAWVVML
jgi:hypothetical protein